MKIRQEINLMCDTILTSTGTLSSSAIVQLDTTAYSGTPTFYFEVQLKGAASNTGTVKLRRFGTTTDDASIAGSTSTTYSLNRSASFTPPAGQTEYMVTLVGDGSRSQSVMVARIIVLQSETAISKTETQVEIGNQTAALSNTTVADMTNPKFWKYTAANWDGAKTFSVEVVYKTSASNTATITLCRTSDNTANVSFGALSTGGVYSRTRTTFTPVDGETYKLRCLGSTTKSTYQIACAKIIMDQSAQSPVSGDAVTTGSGGTEPLQGGTASSGELDQQLGQSFLATASYSCNQIVIGQLAKNGTPTDNLILEVLITSMTGTVIATAIPVAGSTILTSASDVVFTFSSSFSIASGTKYRLRLSRSGTRDITNYYKWIFATTSVLANGGQYFKDNNAWGTESATNDFRFQMYSLVALTKCEPQYLLLNTNDSNATGVQNTLTKWDSTEWDVGSGTVTYKHAMDSDNASNSILLRNVTDSDDVTSTVTGTGQQVSSTLTVGAGELVTGKNYDCWVLNTTGVIAASRIIVTYAFVAGGGGTLFTEIVTATFSPTAALGPFRTNKIFAPTFSPTVVFGPKTIGKTLTATRSFAGLLNKQINDGGFVANLSFSGNFAKSKLLLQNFAATLFGGSAMSDGNPVGLWNDSSGNGNNATAAGSLRPTFKTNIKNGLPVVRFTSAGTSGLNLTSPFGANVSSTILAVMKAASSGSAISCLGSTTASASFGPLPNSDGNLYLGWNANIYFAGTGMNDGAFHVYTSVQPSSNPPGFYQDGTSPGAPVIAGGGTSGTYDAIGRASSSYSDGDIAELVVYGTVLSGTDRANVEKYLGTKYAITVAGGSAVDPSSVSGLVGWWKADSLAVITPSTAFSVKPLKNFLATFSPTAVLTRKLSKGLTAILTFSGILVRRSTRTLAATLSFSGSLRRQVGKSFTAVFFPLYSGSGSPLIRQLNKGLTATLSFVGDFVQVFSGGAHLFLQNFTATLATTGLLTRRTVKSSFTATLSFVGTFARGLSYVKNFTATLFSGAGAATVLDSYSELNIDSTFLMPSSQSVGQAFSSGAGGTLDSCKFYLDRVGSATGNVLAKLYATTGTLGSTAVPTGSALATSDPVAAISLPTTIGLVTFSFSGANRYVMSASTVYCIVCEYTTVTGPTLDAGTDSSTPTHAGNTVTEAFGGGWSPQSRDTIFYLYVAGAGGWATLSLRTGKTFSATRSFVGLLNKRVGKSLTATQSFVGTLSRKVFKRLTATLSFVGVLLRGTLFFKAFTATLSFVGNLATSLIHGGTLFVQSLTGTLTFSGLLRKRPNKNLTATLSFVGRLTRGFVTTFVATLSFVGRLTRKTNKFFNATLSFVGALVVNALGLLWQYYIDLRPGAFRPTETNFKNVMTTTILSHEETTTTLRHSETESEFEYSEAESGELQKCKNK